MADPSDSRPPVPVRDSLTPERIARLRELHEAATPGPWQRAEEFNGTEESWDVNAEGGALEVAFCPEGLDPVDRARTVADAELIAEARNALPDLLAAIEGVRGYADRLIRMSGQHPEVITGDVVWTLRQILAGGPDLPTEESIAAFLAARATQDRGEGGRSAPCVPGTPSDAEASTETAIETTSNSATFHLPDGGRITGILHDGELLLIASDAAHSRPLVVLPRTWNSAVVDTSPSPEFTEGETR